ncbi:MFS transporter [Halorhabdus sp. CUG00001]|uniref:MFS transporter n=1 Tax=Halorhabdus sp. CUG00001 TaxID=2600297 RepID=UPI001E39399B|nr:MFS transporter [Halorhabdus sp. CUG00001]
MTTKSIRRRLRDRIPLSPSAGAALWVIVASGTLTVMAGAILGPVVNQIQSGLGVSQSLAGLIITTHGLFIVLTSPIAGVLIDRYGPRKPYILGLIVYAVAGGAGLVVTSFPVLLVTRAALGVAVAFVYTGVTVLIYNLYEGRRKDRAMGLRASANSVGASVWPLVGGILGTLSWQVPFGVYLIGLPLGVLAFLFVPEPAMASTSSETDESSSSLGALVDVITGTPLLVFVYLLYFLANVLLYSIIVFYPGVLETFGIESSFQISLYLSAMGIAGGVSAALYDRVRQRFSYGQLARIALVLWTIGFAIVPIAESPLVAILPVVLFGLGQGLVFPTAMLWVEELVPPDRKGQFSSYIAMFGYVGQFLSPVLFGPVAAGFGVAAVFGVAAGVVATLLVGTAVWYLA